MSKTFLSRIYSLTRASHFSQSLPLPLMKPPSVARYFASWGPDRVPPDPKEIELRVIKSIATHDKVDHSMVYYFIFFVLLVCFKLI